MEQPKHTCLVCERRDREKKEQEEVHFSVLLSLVPLMVITLFNLAGVL